MKPKSTPKPTKNTKPTNRQPKRASSAPPANLVVDKTPPPPATVKARKLQTQIVEWHLKHIREQLPANDPLVIT